jgi:hypothetical protein
MTLARGIAAIFLDGPWEPDAMVERLRAAPVLDENADAALTPDSRHEAWMRDLAREARSAYAIAPAWELDRFAAWLAARPAFEDARLQFEPFTRGRLRLVRIATPAPEMRESPWRVPPLANTREVAMWLGVGVDALEVLADRHELTRTSPEPARHYRYAWVPKPSGGHRLVEAPKRRLRLVQRDLLDGILAAIPPHEAAHGFRAGRSVAGFAAPHAGRDVVIRVDLRAFFTSVNAARVAGILRTAGYPEGVAYLLSSLCTHRTPPDVILAAPVRDPSIAQLSSRHLPQGAPTSGALANLAAYRLDTRVAGLAATVDAAYTRYADDLVLSGRRTLARAAPSIVARIGAIAAEEGFALNFRKTRVMTRAGRQQIAGVVVNDRPSIPRADREALRALLHNCARHGPASQNRDEHADFRAHLRGRVAWVASIDARQGARLQALFDRIRWE